MREGAKFLLRALSSPIVALVLGLFVAGVSASGVINMELTHVLFALLLVVSVVTVGARSYLANRRWVWRLTAMFATCALLGGALLRVDGWLHVKKAEQDVSNVTPPSLPQRLSTPLPIPAFALSKTRQTTKPPAKVAQRAGDNSVLLARDAQISQEGGENSTNVQTVGSGNTVTVNEAGRAPTLPIGGDDITFTNNLVMGLAPDIRPGSHRVAFSNNIINEDPWIRHLDRTTGDQAALDSALADLRFKFEEKWTSISREQRDRNMSLWEQFEQEARSPMPDRGKISKLLWQLRQSGSPASTHP